MSLWKQAQTAHSQLTIVSSGLLKLFKTVGTSSSKKKRQTPTKKRERLTTNDLTDFEIAQKIQRVHEENPELTPMECLDRANKMHINTDDADD